MFDDDKIITAKQDLFPLTQELDGKLKRAISVAIKTELENIALNNFLAYLSHISRTPLNGLLGMLRLLKETELNEKQCQYLESAIASAERINNAVSEISEFAVKNHSDLTIQDEVFDLFELGKEIIKMLSYKAAEKEIAYEYIFDENVPRRVRGDSVKLKMVLANLFNNAIAFTNKGKVCLSVSCRVKRDVEDRAEIVFQIRDTGVGISEEKLEHIFDFSDKRIATSEYFTKISLELAVCKHIIEKMGGVLFLQSEKLKGTIAVIKLDMQIAAKEAVRKQPVELPQSKSHRDEKFSLFNTRIVKDQKEKFKKIKEKILKRTEKEKTYSGKSNLMNSQHNSEPSGEDSEKESDINTVTKALKVLIAEDDPINQSLAIAFVTKLNMQYELATTGIEAIEKFKQGDIDFILMDCEMPEMDGYEASKEIRNLEKEVSHSNKRHIPIIAMTAYAMQGDKEKCLHVGMDDYIAKPVTYQTLKAMIEKYFL